MPDISMIDAKARLPSLIRQAEAGEPVHLTRRGKRVAVIVSESQFAQIATTEAKHSGYTDFLADWRKRLMQEGCEPLTDQEITSLRPRDLGCDFAFRP